MSPSFDDSEANYGPWGPWETDGVVLSQEQRDAVTQILMGEDPVIVLTGVAGAGKSLIIHFLRQTRMVTVTATTGKAAINVGGITVDSLFCFNRESGNIWADPDYLDYLMRQCADVILIDEASMISMVMMTTIVRVAHRYHKRLVLVGDWGQASPVVTNAPQLRVGNPELEVVWPTDVPEFREHRMIRLTECHRQSDQDMLNALNQIREGRCSEDTDALFRSRVMIGDHPFFDERCLRMFATNNAATGYNNDKLAELIANTGADRHQLEVLFTCKRRRPYTDQQRQAICSSAPMAHNMGICVGARVLFTRNEQPSEDRRFVNGDTGVVEEIHLDEHDLPAEIAVRLDRHGDVILVSRLTLMVEDPSERPLYTLTGFPLRLGWAMTIHKTQGLTTDYAWLDMSSLQAIAWAGGRDALHGLAYVGLSRCRTLEGLYLSSWDPSLIYSDPKVRHLL